MIIYKVTNKLNGKIYIGQTIKSLSVRWRQHCMQKSGCRAIHNAIQKHGRENFTVEQIDVACTREELDAKEIYWIKFYDCLVPNGYNLHTGGRHHETSDETRKKISISLKNSIIFQQALQSEERRKKISESRKGKKRPPFSEEWKLKLGDASRGKKHTAESKRKIGEAHKGMRHSKESIKKMSQTKIRLGCHKGEKNYSFGRFGKDSAVARAVRNVTLNKIFGSAREASRFCGRNESSSIIKCCKGKKKRAYGYEWEYAND